MCLGCPGCQFCATENGVNKCLVEIIGGKSYAQTFDSVDECEYYEPLTDFKEHFFVLLEYCRLHRNYLPQFKITLEGHFGVDVATIDVLLDYWYKQKSKLEKAGLAKICYVRLSDSMEVKFRIASVFDLYHSFEKLAKLKKGETIE